MKKSLLLGSSVAILATSFAVAQEAEDEIVVTATKREQTLQEVPVAVSVVDADAIEKAEINDINDLQSVVPSLRVSTLERSTNATFLIRGFGNGGNNVGVEPSVGVFVDGVYRSRVAASISDLPNLERVEVLRGPQSTLFGKNASAGVISIVTAAPALDEWQGTIEGGIGNYDTRMGKVYVTGPLSEDTAVSFAGTFNKRDGFVDFINGDGSEGDPINERDRWALRAQMLYDPVEDLSVRWILDYDEIDESCCVVPYLLLGPTAPALEFLGGNLQDDPFGYEIQLNRRPSNKLTNKGASVQLDYGLGFAEFVSITAYRQQESESNGDVDFTAVPAIGSNLNKVEIDTFTQELRLTSTGADRLSWMLGGFYFEESVGNETDLTYDVGFRGFADLTVAGLGAPGAFDDLEAGLMLPNGTFFQAGTGSQGTFSQDNESWSIFGQADFEITDRLTATVGLNYTEDEKEFDIATVNNDAFASLDLVEVGFAQIFAGLAGVPPTPENLTDPTYAAAVGQASALSTVECSATTGAACNPLLALQPFQFLPQVVPLPNSVEDNTTEDNNTSYTVRLAYDVAPNINLYGSVATGFKASSVNLTRDSRPLASDFAALETAGLTTPNLTPGTRFADPEDSIVYELGLKANFAKGSVNLAVFDQTIEGFQSVIFTGTGFGLTNAGEQSATGFEVDAVYSPVDNLSLTFSGLFLDPEYDDFVAANGLAADGSQAIVDLSGETPAGIHTVSLVFGALYEVDLGDGKTGFLRADYQYEDEVQVVDNVPEEVASREVNMLNASAGVALENGLEVTVWGRNITNDEFLQSAFPTTAQDGSFSGYPNTPATYGVNVRKRF